MKTIGFVDYYISEWHANNYPQWIKDVCAESGRNFEVKYVWAEKYISPVDGRNTDEWCAEYGCEKCETLAELCQKCDYIMVLSPSNPEKHLKYAEEVLKYGKNTYIDKTFAPDFETAKMIFDIAQKYGTRFFSTSALRYADELEDLKSENAIILGSGGNIEEYIIHQIEMAVTVTGEKPMSLKLEQQGKQYICHIAFENKKRAVLIYGEQIPYAICAEDENGNSVYRTIESSFFKNMISDILRFFENGEYSFDIAQTLDVMKIRTGVIEALGKNEEWITL